MTVRILEYTIGLLLNFSGLEERNAQKIVIVVEKIYSSYICFGLIPVCWFQRCILIYSIMARFVSNSNVHFSTSLAFSPFLRINLNSSNANNCIKLHINLKPGIQEMTRINDYKICFQSRKYFNVENIVLWSLTLYISYIWRIVLPLRPRVTLFYCK